MRRETPRPQTEPRSPGSALPSGIDPFAPPQPETGAERPTRRRSSASLRNDAAILDAARAEVDAVGVDNLAMTKVAKRARLTTGALYGRYETAHELAAAIWSDLVGPRHLALLDAVIAGVVDGDSDAFRRVCEVLQSPGPDERVAIELVAVAHRIDEVEEVLSQSLSAHFSDWCPENDPLRRARALAAVGTVWGALLHSMPARLSIDWTPTLRIVRWACRQPDPGVVTGTDAVGTRPAYGIRVPSGDPTDDALVGSAAAIIGRVGLRRATTTRIARRAGLTPGAIYARYPTKEALLERTFGTVVADWYAANLDRYRTITTDHDRAGDPEAVAAAFSPLGDEWPAFRIEAQIAALHNAGLAAALQAVQDDAQRSYLAAVHSGSDITGDDATTFARLTHVMPLGLSMIEVAVPAVGSIEWRRALAPLERFA